MKCQRLKVVGLSDRRGEQRRGVIVVLTAFLITVLFAFMALSVDTGRVVLTETEMQNAVDAASLAASEEITSAVYAAGQGQGSANIDANSIAVSSARAMAADVAKRNGVYVDPTNDVQFGKRVFNAANGQWTIQWNASPYSVVQVTARRTNANTTAPDGQFPLAFGWAVGKSSLPITTTSTAFVEARDLVLCLDYSASMDDDSSLDSTLPTTEVNTALDNIWAAFRAADPKWPGTTTSKFPATGFGSVNSAVGTSVSSTNTTTILSTLGLTTNVSGHRKYPFPQSGRNSNNDPNPKESDATSDSLWTGYINYVKGLSGTYNKKYGYRTLCDYLEEQRYDPSQSEDLWRTPEYPDQALKDGTTLFLNFLKDLQFGDEVGLVVYGQWAVQQKKFYDGDANVDISADPITSDYDKINTIQLHHQSGEYNGWTAIGDGLLKSWTLLLGDPTVPNDHGFSRYGARPTIILMTDGVTNQAPSGWSMPAGFNWKDWTDYDGNGVADYTTTDINKKYAFYEATLAIQRGCTIHTVGVGAEADVDFLKAIAFAGHGIFIDVPGGSTIAAMHQQMLDAFSQIAAKVPPAQLIYDTH
jgi:Flp pilus assembly protein TadG